jgi:hypothetical protein
MNFSTLRRKVKALLSSGKKIEASLNDYVFIGRGRALASRGIEKRREE